MDDAELKRTVEDELAWAPHLDASGVNVSVREGIVRLTGFVASLAEKKAAERAVFRLRGVRGLAQEIEVLIPAAQRLPDDEIAHSAVHVLCWDSQIPPGSIQLKVERGVVTLVGVVGQQYQKHEAEERVHRLAGVTAVDNRIIVHPAPARANIGHEVEQAFLRNAKLHRAGIVISANGSKVILNGMVRSVEDREEAAELAWRSAGVSDVENRLIVQP